MRLRPNLPGALIDAVVAHVLSSHVDEARRILVEYGGISSYKSISAFKERERAHSAKSREIYVNALRLAGLPE